MLHGCNKCCVQEASCIVMLHGANYTSPRNFLQRVSYVDNFMMNGLGCLWDLQIIMFRTDFNFKEQMGQRAERRLSQSGGKSVSWYSTRRFSNL